MAGSKVTVTRTELARILAAGAEAAGRAEATALDCPYSAAGDADERLRTAAWIRGFVLTRKASS